MHKDKKGATASRRAVWRPPLPVDWIGYDKYIDAVSVGVLRDFARRYFKREGRTQLVVRP